MTNPSKAEQRAARLAESQENFKRAKAEKFARFTLSSSELTEATGHLVERLADIGPIFYGQGSLIPVREAIKGFVAFGVRVDLPTIFPHGADPLVLRSSTWEVAFRMGRRIVRPEGADYSFERLTLQKDQPPLATPDSDMVAAAQWMLTRATAMKMGLCG